jgi:hypothetical protein
MRKRRELWSLLLIAATVIAAPAASRAAVNVDIEIGPPAARIEVAPPPRAGFVWAPGYWRWDHGRHVWAAGHWMRERRGYHWAPDRWVQAGPRWHYERGHWER